MRTISEEFLKDLKDGILSDLTNRVKDKKNKMIMCFRDGYINVYYNSHSLFKISGKQYYVAKFDIGHTRYSKDRKIVIEALKQKYGSVTNKRDYGVAISNDYITLRINKKGKNIDFNDIIAEFKNFTDDFFDTSLNYDYIKGERRKTKKPDLIEKQRQQLLFANNMLADNTDLHFYDMELSLPGKSQAGSPDCLAIRIHNNQVYSLVLVEVKSTITACTGGNGVAKHFIDYNNIINNIDDRKDLIYAMKFALKANNDLGFSPEYQYDANPRFEKLFVFTDEANDFVNNNKQKNCNYRSFLLLDNQEIKVFNQGANQWTI